MSFAPPPPFEVDSLMLNPKKITFESRWAYARNMSLGFENGSRNGCRAKLRWFGQNLRVTGRRRLLVCGTLYCLGGVPREQKMLQGHLPRVMYHQVYQCTKIKIRQFAHSWARARTLNRVVPLLKRCRVEDLTSRFQV